MKVESRPGLATSPAVRRNGGGRVKEDAGDGKDPTVVPIGRTDRLAPSRDRLEDFTPETIEGRLQSDRFNGLSEIRNRGFVKWNHAYGMVVLARLAEALDGLQDSRRGGEGGQERGDEAVVQEEATMALGILAEERFEKTLNGMSLLGPDDRLGPNRQVDRVRLLLTVASRSIGLSGDSWDSFIDRHLFMLWPIVPESASEDSMKFDPESNCFGHSVLDSRARRSASPSTS